MPDGNWVGELAGTLFGVAPGLGAVGAGRVVRCTGALGVVFAGS